MAYTAYQPLFYNGGIPLDKFAANTTPESDASVAPVNRSPTITLDSRLKDVLNTSASDIVMKPVANDNFELLAKLNERIRNNPQLKALQDNQPDQTLEAEQITSLTVDPERLALAQAQVIQNPVEPVIRETDEKPATVSVVDEALQMEIERIKLRETMRFMHELQTDRQHRRTKGEIKQFLKFAAAQAALSVVEPNAVPELAQLSAADSAVSFDGPVVQKAAAAAVQPVGKTDPLQLNPLALETLADHWGQIAPHLKEDAKPQARFQANQQAVTHSQPVGGIAAQPDRLSAPAEAELNVILNSSVFDASLVREAEELSRGIAAGVAPQLAPQELRVQELIKKGRKQRAKDKAEKLEQSINLTSVRAYDMIVTSKDGRRLGRQTVKAADVRIEKPQDNQLSQEGLSLTQPDLDVDGAAKAVSSVRDDIAITASQNILGSFWSEKAHVCLERNTDNHKIKSKIAQVDNPDKEKADPEMISRDFSQGVQETLGQSPELAKLNFNVAFAV